MIPYADNERREKLNKILDQHNGTCEDKALAMIYQWVKSNVISKREFIELIVLFQIRTKETDETMEVYTDEE